ncbi:hypothetical protein [Legionella fallonii]|uniref:Uncharacterized protein n=1 Tax=Legionella fallonii LLAP-10 TaxID=1212491 RepID=A0A098G0S9_9GAMM|nr:hypothetical protein [Legionella fallonii]CEG55566.1 protein of unknown function [Legionella fallonii LLAP-10]
MKVNAKWNTLSIIEWLLIVTGIFMVSDKMQLVTGGMGILFRAALFVLSTVASANPEMIANEPHRGFSNPHAAAMQVPREHRQFQNVRPHEVIRPLHGPNGVQHNEINVPQIQHKVIQQPIVKPIQKPIQKPIHHGLQPTVTPINTPKPITPTPNKTIHPINPYNNNRNFYPAHVVVNTKPSHLNNPMTQQNLHHAMTWNQQFVHAANNAQWVHEVNGYQQQYHKQFYNYNVQRFNVYGHYWQNNHYHNWYNAWYHLGFYGGFWYPVRPFYAIENYFTYPVVQWFFVDEAVAPQYYTNYYVSQPAPPPACIETFPYKNVYFPTDTLRDLLVEVSGFPQQLRCNFREAIIGITSQLKDDMSNYFALSFTFRPDDIVINYYQNLQGQAIVIAGFVSQNKINMAFEALLDLRNPNNSIVFAPDGQTPTEEQLQVLNQLNSRIKNLGGDPFTAQQEPAPSAYNANSMSQGSAAGP